MPRSQSPDNARKRSRSPESRRRDKDGERPKKKKEGSGFKWKEKRKDTSVEEAPKGLERGYRERSPRRDRETKPVVPGSVEDKFGVSIDDKFGAGASSKLAKAESTQSKIADSSKPPVRKAAAAAASSRAPKPSNEPMIIVHVNDRLGTKAAIPCLASDTIGMFKHMVAARIGRPVHELLLKRQSERPFKDQLTLEDYGISNGVQIDLEIDTGG